MRRAVRPAAGLVVVLLGAASCGTSSIEVTPETVVDDGGAAVESPTSTTSIPPSTTTAAPSTTATTAATTTTSTSTTTTTTTTSTTTTTTTTTIPLEYNDTGFVELGLAMGLPLYFPAAQYEHIGFHQSGHDGSRQIDVTGAADWRTLEDRGRGTGSRTAADIVVPPDATIYAPVSGTVVRTGSYVLYCDHTDNFVVIDPAGQPGWEVKMFHFEGLSVSVGDVVEAGVTVVGSNARRLPFVSQVDEFTAEPSNPHVHVEVIDPSIPDRPSTGGGC